MLTTNMIRKELNSQNQYEAGLALSGLSCFVSHDLARDLANDIMTLVCRLPFFVQSLQPCLFCINYFFIMKDEFNETVFADESCSDDV